MHLHLIAENGVSWAAHLHLCPSDAADPLTGDQGWQQHPASAAGDNQVCHHQVSGSAAGCTANWSSLIYIMTS